MLEYLLPLLRSHKRLFSLPRRLAKQISRRPIRRLVASAFLGFILTTGMSIGALSLIPIDECDLYGASAADALRIGPPIYYRIVEVFYQKHVANACWEAANRHPDNGRFWFQLERATADHEKGLTYLNKAAALDYPAALNSIAFYHEHYDHSRDHLKTALHYYEKAYEAGNFESLKHLGVVYEDMGDNQRALDIFKRYVTGGGIYNGNLAKIYRDGILVPKNESEYVRLLKIGAEGGDAWSAEDLGYCYHSGEYVEQDAKKANEYYLKAIRYGANATAALNLGINHQAGDGVLQDYEKATYWFILAAKFGESAALSKLDDLIASGKAVFKKGHEPPAEQMQRNALRKIAADAGDAEAAYLIGSNLETQAEDKEGEQKAKLLDEARSWYLKAAEKGLEGAKKAIERLTNDQKE